MNTKHCLLSLSAFAASLNFAAATSVFQIDLQMAGSPASQETQSGWTAWDVTKTNGSSLPHVTSVSNTVAGVGITITANGAGARVTARGGNPELRGGEITGTSWDDMVEDFAVARQGDGTATIALTGLDSSLTYALAVWGNESYDNAGNTGFSGGTVSPSMAIGTVVGAADTGLITYKIAGAHTDGEFDPVGISFMPDGAGNASILMSSTSNFVLFNGLELNSVPEPSTGILAALAGLALIRRRR